MAHISDRDRRTFEEAYKTVLDNFTADEQVHIGKFARELNFILEAARKREKEKLAKGAQWARKENT